MKRKFVLFLSALMMIIIIFSGCQELIEGAKKAGLEIVNATEIGLTAFLLNKQKETVKQEEIEPGMTKTIYGTPGEESVSISDTVDGYVYHYTAEGGDLVEIPIEEGLKQIIVNVTNGWWE